MKFETPILAIIVLYKTKLAESKSFMSLTKSLINNNICLDLFVYDNSPVNNYIDAKQYPNWNIIYHHDEVNSGVSKAYNTGAEYALKMNKRWLLLLDQDTGFPTETIGEYLKSIAKYPNQKLFVPVMKVNEKNIISPCRYKFMRGFYGRDVNIGINSLNKVSLINCGLCIDLRTFIKNNGYNELIKLDFSDHDFIHRLKKNGISNFVMIDVVVNHELSSEIKNSLLSDEKRFDYYLEGSSLIVSNLRESFFLIINSFLRACKLSVQHKNSTFIKKVLKHHFKS